MVIALGVLGTVFILNKSNNNEVAKPLLSSVVKVGDYVDYNPGEGNTYTSSESKNGKSDQTFTTTGEENLTTSNNSSNEVSEEYSNSVNNNDNSSSNNDKLYNGTLEVGNYTLQYGEYTATEGQYTDDRGVVSYEVTVTLRNDGTYILESSDNDILKDSNGTYEVKELYGETGIELSSGNFYAVRQDNSFSVIAGSGTTYTYKGK